MPRDPVRLMMVTAENNNKFYNMDDIGGGNLEVTYGRVGTPGTKKIYPISDWDKIYRSKTGKGYKDISNLKITRQQIGMAVLSDPEIQRFLDEIYNQSRQYTSQHYNIETAISTKQIDEAQNLLNNMMKIMDMSISDDDKLSRINKLLLELFTVLPRRIADVRNEVITHINDVLPRIQKEQNLLNNLSVQAVQQPTNSNQQVAQTYFERYGFNMAKVTDKEFDMIAKRLDKEANATLIRAWTCRNPARDSLLEDYLNNNGLTNDDTNVKLYWHGTGKENVFSIAANGLLLRPTNVAISGKAFGEGIYSGPKANKSLNYADRGGLAYLFLNAVVMGNMYKVHSNTAYLGNIRIRDLTQQKFSQNNLGYHSVYAEANSTSYIARDEAIVYNQDQIASRYLCEVRR